MRKVVLISCVSRKLAHPARAQDLYISPLFRLNLAYAKSLSPDAVYILSAAHGLVELHRKLAPYNETLNTKKDAEIRTWADKVMKKLSVMSDPRHDEFVFLAGERYRRHLVPKLARVRIPLEGLGLGRQLQLLKRATA
ncbi:MAG TPA: hypothetical protein VF803_01225 [Candidatus Paceibacterota bacterium]